VSALPEVDPQDWLRVRLEHGGVARGLRGDERPEGEGSLWDLQVLRLSRGDLEERPDLRAALVELAGGVQEAGASAEGHGTA